jgi:hypothetical protein
MESPTFYHWCELLIKLLGFGGLIVVFLSVGWPTRQDEAKLNRIEADLGQIKVKQSALDTRQKSADAKIAEAKANRIAKPIIQLTPGIAQSDSIVDTREIRLELLAENVGDADATIRRIQVCVESGTPNKRAEEAIARTRDFYYDRLQLRDGLDPLYESAPKTSPFPLAGRIPNPDMSPAPAPAPAGPSEVLPESPSGIGTRRDPAVSAATYDSPTYQRRHGYGIPYHEVCPHGMLFAITDESPDITWSAIVDACQTFKPQQMLKPHQSATQQFTYLLTELPLQHNRQWLKFKIGVEYQGEESHPETQQYTLYVSGLPLTQTDGGKRTVSYSVDAPSTVQKRAVEYRVWRPEAPLMPSSATEPPSDGLPIAVPLR